MTYKRAAFISIVLLLASWAVVYSGIIFGEQNLIQDRGFPKSKPGVGHDLFRFDSWYYYEIASHGYSYDWRVDHNSNIVFAPLFPMLVRLVYEITSLDMLWSGRVLCEIENLLAVFFLLLTLSKIFGDWPSVFILLAVVTSEGCYSLHSFYSESTMLLFMSLSLFAYSRGKWVLLALSAFALGASRLTALPLVLLFSVKFMREAWRQRQQPLQAMQSVFLAALCSAGGAAYLGYIWFNFENPFRLLPQIEKASFGMSEPSFAYMFIGFWEHWKTAITQLGGWQWLANICYLNLIWTSLALISVVYVWKRFGNHLWSYLFSAYFVFVYYNCATTLDLQSSHRYYMLMLPIFFMFADLHKFLALRFSKVLAWMCSIVFLAINAIYGMGHVGFFNQGIWYYF